VPRPTRGGPQREYKEHERAELLDKMVGWMYTLNEAAAEGTNTRITMEQVRRITELKSVPAGKQSHKQRREWTARVAEAVERGIIDEEIACRKSRRPTRRPKRERGRGRARWQTRQRRQPAGGESSRAGTSAAEAERGSDEGGDQEGIPGNGEDGKGRRGFRQPRSPGTARRRTEKARKLTRRDGRRPLWAPRSRRQTWWTRKGRTVTRRKERGTPSEGRGGGSGERGSK